MPPRFLTEEEKKRLNAAHTEKILLDLGKWQNELGNDPPEEEEEEEGGEEEAVCNRFRARAPDEMANLLAMPDDVDVLERPMSEIMASADAQHSALLKKPKFVTRTSNRDEAFARWLYNNVRSRFEEEVPIRCALFELMPWQRAAAVAMTNPMEEETFVQLDIPRAQMEKLTPRGCRKTPFGVKYSIEAGALPVITLAHLPTGAGKTIIALVAALILLCSSNKWTQLRQSYREILRVRLRETHSGLCKGESVSNGKLARLAVIIVPHNLMSHWEAQAKAAVFGAKECYGQHTDVVLWRGRHHEHSVENAYNSGKPTLWILAMEPDSMKMLCKTPNIGYCARICDELSMRMQARYNQKESPVLYNYIVSRRRRAPARPRARAHARPPADPSHHRLPLQGHRRAAAPPAAPRAGGIAEPRTAPLLEPLEPKPARSYRPPEFARTCALLRRRTTCKVLCTRTTTCRSRSAAPPSGAATTARWTGSSSTAARSTCSSRRT